MDFNNNQNEPQNQQNSNVSYQPKKGTFFKKKIILGVKDDFEDNNCIFSNYYTSCFL